MLVESEKNLVKDIALFDQFLEKTNQNTNDAIRRQFLLNILVNPCFRIYEFSANEESQKKDELINEIKQLQKNLVTYQNNHKHLIDRLKQQRRYQQFLFKFAPEVRYDCSFFVVI